VAICGIIWYLAHPSGVATTPNSRQHSANSSGTRRTLRPIPGTTARHVAHSEHFIAFAHPGNESLRGQWIESRGELFSVDPIVKD